MASYFIGKRTSWDHKELQYYLVRCCNFEFRFSTLREIIDYIEFFECDPADTSSRCLIANRFGQLPSRLMKKDKKKKIAKALREAYDYFQFLQ